MFTLRFAIRSLLRSPGFCAIAIVTLALGIGLNTSMFSMLNGFLLRPLTLPAPDQLFRLDRSTSQQTFGRHSFANYEDIVRAADDVAELAAYRGWGFTLTEPDAPADTPRSLRVTANYFDVLGRKPVQGRKFHAEEDAVGRNQVIVISHEYWQRRFHGSTDTLGHVVRLDGEPVEIVGILPPDPDTVRYLGPVDIYRPHAPAETERLNRADHSNFIIGRYREGVTPAEADARFAAIAGQLAADHPLVNGGAALDTRSLQSTTLTGAGRTMTFLLICLSGFVLLIACANLANLLLARAISRAREFSIRSALGASRAQLLKPLAAECLVLVCAGGLAATLVSVWATSWLSGRFGSPQNPVDFSSDGRVLVFTLAASAATALLFGIAPAWWTARLRINTTLKSGARGATDSRSQQRFRQVLIVSQFAFALVLLAGAGFFLRGLDKLSRVNTGWNPDPMIVGTVNLASAAYSTAEPLIAFHASLRDRLTALPGVANVAVSYEVPLYPSPSQRSFLVEGREPPPPGQEITADTNGVSASYFDTVGTRILRGRAIDETDRLDSRPVVVINEHMARALFPEGNAIGERISQTGLDTPQWAEIVGIAEDTRPFRIGPLPVTFQVYKPYSQEAWQYVTFSVRATDPDLAPTLLEPIREAVTALDREQPVFNLMTVPALIELNLEIWRTINQLLILFAGLGLLLAALGIYGIIARLVSQRTNEIGIRMALGAQVRDVVMLVLTGGLRTALIGAAFGLAGAWGLSLYLNSSLPAFGGNGMIPIAAAGVLLIVVALAACWFPARRAAKVDPVVALRAE